jgi:hypothetical protein
MEKLIIPKKIKVGFNRRPDTYSGKLGYVIYHDGKVWRKENSWENWREKEATEEQIRENIEYYNENYHKKNPLVHKEINQHELIPKYFLKHRNMQVGVEPIEFDNAPTEGFVLNKKVGGYASDWGSFRQAYARVFDPRGFEFEITLPNLLYILEYSNSIKGKGLEGKFVYSWDKKDLVLLPVDSPDYEKCVEFTEMQKNKISAKDLVPGISYVTKQRENMIYMGRFDWNTLEYNREIHVKNENVYQTKTVKTHVFYIAKNDTFHIQSGISNISHALSNDVVQNYADLILKLDEKKEMHKIVDFVYEKKDLKVPDFDNNTRYGQHIDKLYQKIGEKSFLEFNLSFEIQNRYLIEERRYETKFLGYELKKIQEIKFENGFLIKTYIPQNINYTFDVRNKKDIFTKEEVLNNDFVELYFLLDNGKKIDIRNF